ncbi:Two-component response regulator SSK1p [Didymosphaeria variabile]|uniref:Two-component response regulator SSK1p n=1 Tax=Didymosphaeria variabile TaxID=1932322 RepID=A0A9W8XMJ0_9PLEO|nr:Two-component response regulator SSK1p [Didymosphaeria variabile]KAJ4355365.1 Two-component response regulator SSK1p [Didymosphaeria variabile]
MSSIRSRISHARAKLLRRQSHISSSASQCSSAGSERIHTGSSLRKSVSLSKLPAVHASDVPAERDDNRMVQSEVMVRSGTGDGTSESRPETLDSSRSRDRHSQEGPSINNVRLIESSTTSLPHDVRTANPTVTLEEPTPVHPPSQPPPPPPVLPALAGAGAETAASEDRPSELPSLQASSRPTPARRQSLVTPSNARAIKTLLASDPTAAGPSVTGPPTATDYFSGANNFSAGMLHRKIWVKRLSASATLVQIREDDLVDDVREMILKKYGNSLGRSFDAPDLTLRILPRDSNGKGQERILGPEEEMCRTLDAYYPGGQTVHEALIIDIPIRAAPARTPKPSPRIPQFYAHHDDSQNHHQTEYFPLMPIANPSPMTAASHETTRASLPHQPHSIQVLQTGHLPALPSPGGTRRTHANRPKAFRHNTASPTTLTGGVPQSATTTRPQQRIRHDSSASEKHSASSNQAIPTPPAPADPNLRQNSTPPTPRVSSPKPDKKRKKQKPIEPPSLPPGLLDNSVPPINVLIVEDNIINLRVLGAFMQRLKVRWQRAMNGKEAVEKWRAGGFHLVLMDIQLPIMDGLEATREIRRLERVNSIGVFSSGSSEAPNNRLGDKGLDRDLSSDDILGDKNLFKSPVIIVALTASSLQSDRHEALAAGCNDFLTKPVNFVWLERKVKEWGCMQALIDFDGWRRWKDFTNASDTTDGTSKLSTSYSSVAPRKGKAAASPTTSNAPNGAGPSTINGTATKPKDDVEKKSKRRSMGVVPPPALVEEESAASTPDVDSGEN